MPWSRVVPALLECPPGDLCQRPYPNHKKGCPNYNQRGICPPGASRWTPGLIAERDFVAIWNAFDFGGHVARMQEKHPDWSQRQLECCLYWQGTARRQLREEANLFLFRSNLLLKDVPVEYIPEAHGVNVTETMRRIGIELEWPPKTTTYQIALASVAHDMGGLGVVPEKTS